MADEKRERRECQFCGYETDCTAYESYNHKGYPVEVFHCDICANVPLMAFTHSPERELARTICAAANVILDAVKGKSNA